MASKTSLHFHFYREIWRRSVDSFEYKHLMYVERKCKCGKLKGKYL
jgi:hypothetical protein